MMINLNRKQAASFSLVILYLVVTVLFLPTDVLAYGDTSSVISAGIGHSSAIKADGSLWLWGRNAHGQLGDGTTIDKHTPQKILDNVTSASAGMEFTMAVKTDGSLWAWGANNAGQLGDGTAIDRYAPTKIMDGVVSVSAGSDHAMAIKTDGSLWVWGDDYWGQLGVGTEYWKAATIDYSPIKLMDGVVAVSAGDRCSLAIKTDATLWAWGRGFDSQIPVKIADGVKEVSSGLEGYSVALKTDGTLWNINYKNLEQMNGIKSISGGGNEIMAIRIDGGLLWSRLNAGVEVLDGVAAISNGTIRSARDGDYRMAVKTDSTLWVWGNNEYGQLGDGTTTDKDTPANIIDDVKLPDGFIPSTETAKTTETANTSESTEAKPFSLGVHLTWYPSDNPKGYNIYRSKIQGEKGDRINSRPVFGGEYIDANANSNTIYYYTICEISEDGQTDKPINGGTQVEAKTGEIAAGITGKRGFMLMQIGEETMIVNGEVVEIDHGRGTVPLIKNGRTLLPIRAIVEAMNGSVGWEETERKVDISALGHSLEMWLGRKDMTVDGKSAIMDVSAEAINGRTMLPLRFVAENVGCLIEWIGTTKEVVIVYPL